jgi:hypothetical protein
MVMEAIFCGGGDGGMSVADEDEDEAEVVVGSAGQKAG